MGNYYEKSIRLEVAPKRVLIFTLSTTVKKTWYVRIRKREGKGYFTQSLKTENEEIAKARAQDLYFRLWSSEAKGVEFVDARFSPLFGEFIENGGLSKHRYTRAKGVFQRYFGPYFGNTPVGEIDGKSFIEYLRWRVDYWKRAEEQGTVNDEVLEGGRVYHYKRVPAETTLKSERQILKQFLYYCAENRYIETVPHLKANMRTIRGVEFVQERQKAKALTGGPGGQEQAIERALRKFCITDGQRDKNWLRQYGRARLYYFIQICKHTLIRPSTEATALLWSDVELNKSRKHKGLSFGLINVRESKTGTPRTCVMPYGQVHYLTEWRQLCLSFGFGKPEDYVFPNWNGERVKAHILGRLLRDKLSLWGLHRNEEGKVNTLYSIVRHTGITRRIENSKWDVGQVATAAGTSIQQISRFYYQSFVKQDPDRWAITFRSGVPKLEDKKKAKIQDAVAEWERTLAGFSKT